MAEPLWIRGAHGDYHLVVAVHDTVTETWCGQLVPIESAKPIEKRTLSEYFDAFHDECLRREEELINE